VVFASRSGQTPIVGYRKVWLRIAKLGDLTADITPHVLRHKLNPAAHSRPLRLVRDLSVVHRQKVEWLREAGQYLNAFSPGSNIRPRREVFATEPRESDVAVAANVGNCRRIPNEEWMA
jgi:hypothetical protein